MQKNEELAVKLYHFIYPTRNYFSARPGIQKKFIEAAERMQKEGFLNEM